MEAFCSGVEAGPGAEPLCRLDMTGACMALAFSGLASLMACCIPADTRRPSIIRYEETRFACYYWRACLMIVLLIIQTMEIIQYFVSLGSSHHVPYFVIVTPGACLLSLVTGLMMHGIAEKRRIAGLLVFEIVFWISSACWRFMRVMGFRSSGYGWEYAATTMSAFICILLVLLAVGDILTVYVELRFRRSLYDLSKKSFLDQHRHGFIQRSSYNHNKASAYSQMIFWWLNSLLWAGNQEPLELEELGELPIEENAATQYRRFNEIYQNEIVNSKLKNKSISLWRCYFEFVWPNYLIGGVCKLLGDCVGLVAPLGISVIIQYTSTLETSSGEPQTFKFPTLEEFFTNGYVMGVVVFVSAVAQGTFSQNSTHLVNIEGIRLKSALQSLVYTKYLRLASWSVKDIQSKLEEEQTVNENESASATNLMSEDPFNIMSFIWIGHYIWAIPLKIGVLMYLLYLKLGISSIIGATVCILIMTPLQFMIGKRMSSNSKKTIERSDLRMMKINELLQGIKVLKMYGWETIYGQKIMDARSKELELLDKESIYWALITFLTHASSVLITLLTFGIYFLVEKDHLTPSNVFTGLALFNQLTVPLFIFPVTVPIIISALVSTKRLSDFLSLPEINDKRDYTRRLENSRGSCISKSSTAPSEIEMKPVQSFQLGNIEELEEENYNDDHMFKDTSSEKNSSTNSSIETLINPECSLIKITNAVFAWGDDSKSKIEILESIKIPKGKLTIVVGKTGSGKSTFLSALIGELNLIKGKISWAKSISVAYTSQKPWLLNASIRENIIFGSAGDEFVGAKAKQYARIISSCALKSDLSSMIGKDRTDAGENGASLSGGQKQRVILARALFSGAELLILDDPLAALDQPVALKVFEKAIKRSCTRYNKTVIMVTHRLQLLSQADEIIYVNNGIVRSMGSLSQVEELEPALAREWRSHLLRNGRREETATLGVPLDEKHLEKSAKERWQLVKIVNKASHQLRTCHEKKPEEEVNTSFIPLKRKPTIFHGSRYFSHDLVLPTDEWGEELLRSVTPKRTSTRRQKMRQSERLPRKHKMAERSSSLQVSKHKVKPVPIKRQNSSPTIRCNGEEFGLSSDLAAGIRSKFLAKQSLKKFDSNPEGNQVTRQKSIIKRLLSRTTSRKSTFNSTTKQHEPGKLLISTKSTFSEEAEDDIDFLGENGASEKQMTYEEREYGKIPKTVYLEYFKACGVKAASLYIGSSVAWQCLRVYTDVWLSDWTTQEGFHNQTTHSQEETFDIMTSYFTGYAILSVVSILLTFASNAVGQYAGALARETLHQKLLNNVIRCPISFFETTPLGRMMNRFSTDVGIIDKKIATSMQRLVQFLLMCLSAILINAVVSPWFLVLALPICVIYYLIQKFYRASARELQRLDAITKSPIFSHFNETLNGLPTIRAYGQQERFTNILWTKMDINTNAFIILNSSNRWLGIALDYLGAVIVFAATIVALISANLYPESVTPSLVGLAVNYTLLVPIYLNWVVKFLADMEMYMSAVERVKHYSEMTTEDYRENYSVRKDWPQQGEICFKSVSLRYGDNQEPVVHNIELLIPAGQKVALCGRTGSGKSTLLLSLLGLVDVISGEISIDGKPLNSIPLKIIRDSIATVPQEDVLFGGTIRDNLDPYGLYTDNQLWEVLEKINLKSVVSSYPEGLDGAVSEGGAGWSIGSRALLSLGRTLLKRRKILVMDEPTAALDPSTEALVLPQMLPENCTVINIVHRLSSIMDYDRVLVMDSGRIVEDGSPKELLERSMSIFSSMVRAAE